ncbi:MAG: AAA-like domain-containing protein [Desertifilum sp.]|nr:AAA-like domain-containing protein [Desertifilum sp.]
MDVKDALEFVDNLLYAKTGKHLNDLERQVFIGSWQGQTYEKIYPTNAEYIEKYVGYKLWQKLSQALGEKVSKKKIKGAIERALKKRVFISYCPQEPDLSLAVQLGEAIQTAGHRAFMANVRELPSAHHPQRETDWLKQIDAELQQSDYFLLLLSPTAAMSEMLIEELRQVKELRDTRYPNKPAILTIRVNCPLSVPLNHDLRSYLRGTGQREWKSTADTSAIIQEFLNILAGNALWTQAEWGGEEEEMALPKNHPVTLPALDPPLPVAEPELPKGQVRLASAFYVERMQIDLQCHREILKPGALIRLKAPRQMGKTSLMARILATAREQGYRTVPLSFQHADKSVFANLNELLRWFCTRIARKLRLSESVDEFWTDTYGSKDNCTAYFEDCILPEADTPLALGLDEVDRVFQHPKIADDFFGLLRAWYEEAAYGDRDSDLWDKLRLVVVHSTEVYIPLDVNQSPFNVGLPIELTEFTVEQVSDLVQRHGLHWEVSEIEQLMRLVGGHPYLVRVALYYIAQQELTLDALVDTASTEAGIYSDHLRRHLWNLQQYPELAQAFAQVVAQNDPVELESVLAFKLHSLGLVHLQGNQVTPRFELYRTYFGDRLPLVP